MTWLEFPKGMSILLLALHNLRESMVNAEQLRRALSLDADSINDVQLHLDYRMHFGSCREITLVYPPVT